MFQMQEWKPLDYCTCGFDWNTSKRGHKPKCPYPTTTRRWVPMEEGAAAAAWRPRPTAQDAVHKCLRWTGLVCIPSMQVVDLDTGHVAWRGIGPYEDGDAGPVVTPPWFGRIEEQVRAEQRADCQRDEDRMREAEQPSPAQPEQLDLFA